ncbi:MAG: YtoQ family protein [Gammaproteobacteria bacterium]|nr:YtoQ family protein [Gammaproteobacteria bacterium]
MSWKVYLSGEIHTDWRKQIIEGCKTLDLPISFSSAVTDHDASDGAGDVLGIEDSNVWRDHKSAKVNAIRIRTLLKHSDIAIIRFGNKYKQWNAAFDAGFCASSSIPYITLHDEGLTHALKEVDGAAMATAETTEQVIQLLQYTVSNT